MRTKKSFVFSIALHILIIGGVVLFSTLPKQEIEEEIVLQLAMSTPEMPNQQQENKSTPPKPPELKPVQQKPLPVEQPQLPIAPKAKVVEPVAEPVKVPMQPVAKDTPAPPKVEPVAVKKVEPVSFSTPPPVPKQNIEEEYLDNHLGTIRDTLVKYRKYPMMAVRLKQEGSVRVSFRLKENGSVEDIQILEGSGFEILDQDAIALIEKTAAYFPKPPKTIRITVPLSYSLKR